MKFQLLQSSGESETNKNQMCHTNEPSATNMQMATIQRNSPLQSREFAKLLKPAMTTRVTDAAIHQHQLI